MNCAWWHKYIFWSWVHTSCDVIAKDKRGWPTKFAEYKYYNCSSCKAERMTVKFT